MSIVDPKPSFPQRLKEETSYLHQALESLPLSQSILKENVTQEDYLIYLGLMFDIVSDIESAIFPLVSTVISDLEHRKKAHLLTLDFEKLGYIKSNNTPAFSDLEHTISLGFAIGMLYVIEGSTLGGRVIYKHIQKTLGYSSENGAAYFAGYGDQTGQFWKNFIGELVEHEKSEGTGEEIIAGANYTFKAITTHFAANSGS